MKRFTGVLLLCVIITLFSACETPGESFAAEVDNGGDLTGEVGRLESLYKEALRVPITPQIVSQVREEKKEHLLEEIRYYASVNIALIRDRAGASSLDLETRELRGNAGTGDTGSSGAREEPVQDNQTIPILTFKENGSTLNQNRISKDDEGQLSRISPEGDVFEISYPDHRITLGFVLNRERNWYDLEFAIEEDGQERIPLSMTGARPHLLINYQTVFPSTGETRIQLNGGPDRPAADSSALTGQEAPQLSSLPPPPPDADGGESPAPNGTALIAEDPAADQLATAEQPATTDQLATAEQPATTDQLATADQPATTDQLATADQPTTADQLASVAAEPADDPVITAESVALPAVPPVLEEPDTAWSATRPAALEEETATLVLEPAAAKPPTASGDVPDRDPVIAIGQSGEEEPRRDSSPQEPPRTVTVLSPQGIPSLEGGTVEVVLIMSPGVIRPAAGERAPIPGTYYTVQVGAFREQKNAAAAYAALERGGFNPLYEYHQNLTRVVIPVADQGELVRIREEIKALGFGDLYVRR